MVTGGIAAKMALGNGKQRKRGKRAKKSRKKYLMRFFSEKRLNPTYGHALQHVGLFGQTVWFVRGALWWIAQTERAL